MMLVEFGDDVVAVDCGLMFPDPDEMPGIDYVIPDFSYAVAKRDGFRAVLLTHGHEDHIGALPYLLRTTRIPVYGTPLTLALVAEKLREHNLLETADLRPMKPHDRIEAGPFRIEPIRVTHSIADGIGLAIDTPVGTIVHTGDFKLDPSPLDGETPDYKRFTELGEHGVLLLCSDSTNVGRPGHTRSELDVGVALRERFQRASGRIVVATFASHIHRIQQVLTLAAEHGRRVALLGMSMEKNVRVASELGYLRVPGDLMMPLDDLVALPPGRQVILSTGSQGEPNSALSLLATQGLVGFDPHERCFFHRELPFDRAKIEDLHPRLKEARALIADGAVTIEAPGKRTGRASVRTADVAHRVSVDADAFHCTCLWHARTGGESGPCKHVLAAMLAMDGQQA